MTWFAIKLLLGGWIKRIGAFLTAAFKWCLAHPWQAATIGLALFSVWLWWYDGRKIDNLTATVAIRDRTIKDMKAASAKADKDYRAAETKLAADFTRSNKEKTDAIARITANRDALLDELRKRPSRSSAPTSSPAGPGDGKAFVGATGAELFREDASFLVREAARADTVRESLKACYVQYDAVRDMLAGFSRTP